MKKLTLIAVVIFTTVALQSCREADEVLSPEEAVTLQRVQDSSNNLLNKDNNTNTTPVSKDNTEVANPGALVVDGEIAPPPKK